MDAATFFARLNALMKDHPPAAADADAMKRFAAIGVAPGKPFDLAKLDPAVAKEVERGSHAAREKIVAGAKKLPGNTVNNWLVPIDKMGRYGTDYLFRSIVARIGLGSNLPEDGVYPITRVDAEGRATDRREPLRDSLRQGAAPAGRRVLVGDACTTRSKPSWTIRSTATPSAIATSSKFDADGSLTLYVQHESPGKDKESNWLPAPKDSVQRDHAAVLAEG